MKSKSIAIALCVILSPLIAAQRVGPAEQPAPEVAPAKALFAYRISMLHDDSPNPADESGSLYGLSDVPFETPVELTALDPEAWANATVGSTLTFRIVRNVIARGEADANAGTLIEAKVIRMRKGKRRTRGGKTEPRVKEVLVGKHIKLDLERSPGGHARFSAFAKNLLIWPVKVICTVGEYTFLAIVCTIAGGCEI